MVKEYLIAVVVCISLMTYDSKHLFMCLSAICVLSLEKCLIKSFVHFKVWLFVLLLNYKSSLYILNTTSLSYENCKYVLDSMDCLFNFLMIPFESQCFLILMKSSLSVCLLLCHV